MGDITNTIREKWGKSYSISLVKKEKKHYIAVSPNIRADMEYINELMTLTKQLNKWGIGNNLIHMIKVHESELGPEVDNSLLLSQADILLPLGVSEDDDEWM